MLRYRLYSFILLIGKFLGTIGYALLVCIMVPILLIERLIEDFKFWYKYEHVDRRR